MVVCTLLSVRGFLPPLPAAPPRGGPSLDRRDSVWSTYPFDSHDAHVTPFTPLRRYAVTPSGIHGDRPSVPVSEITFSHSTFRVPRSVSVSTIPLCAISSRRRNDRQ